MDPLDDFEFKPLTEGLGFHRKAQQDPAPAKISNKNSASNRGRSSSNDVESRMSDASIMEAPSSSSLITHSDHGEESSAGHARSGSPKSASQSISDLIASLPPSLDFIEDSPKSSLSMEPSRPTIFQPLGRTEYVSPGFENPAPKPISKPNAQTIGQVLPSAGSKSTSPTSATIAAPLLTRSSTPAAPTAAPSAYRERLDEGLARAFPHAVVRSTETASGKTPETKPRTSHGLVPIPAHMGAAVLDGMVVSGTATVLLVCILVITHVNLWGLLSNAQTDGPTQLHLVLLFLAVLQIYMLTARSFFNASLGEWAFDLQLGTNLEQQAAIYPLQAAWRTMLMTITGLVILPIASLVARKDMAKSLTGLQMFRRP